MHWRYENTERSLPEFTIYYDIVRMRKHVTRDRLPKFRSFQKFSKASRDSTARGETFV